MKLDPTANLSKAPGSPTKGGIQAWQEQYQDAMTPIDSGTNTPGSPTRRSNKENTPPARNNNVMKDSTFTNQAAVYRTQDSQRPASPTRSAQPTGASTEDLLKLQKASVKRMANVTQLCQFLTFTAILR